MSVFLRHSLSLYFDLKTTPQMLQKTGTSAAQMPATFNGLVGKLLQYSATSATEIKCEDSKEKKDLDEMYKNIEALDKEIEVFAFCPFAVNDRQLIPFLDLYRTL
jgi:glycine betaine/choline ABC-type transport system substrate-binding protein